MISLNLKEHNFYKLDTYNVPGVLYKCKTCKILYLDSLMAIKRFNELLTCNEIIIKNIIE